jgi:uncharacterized protein YbcC (UPF0753/DUF2309 family)
MNETSHLTSARRQHIRSALAQLDRVLSNQAPLPVFVHHNPLHGYQDLPFEQALAAAKAFTGINGYWPEATFRALYQQGRINDVELNAALQQDVALQAQAVILTQPVITKAAVCRIAMLFELEPVLPNELAWQIEELNTLENFQPDIPLAVQQQLLAAHEGCSEKTLIADLWELILNKLELEQAYLHPENRLDLSLDQAEALLAQHKASQKKVSLKKATLHERMQEAVTLTFAQELQRLGSDISLRNLMMDLCGVDILDYVRPQIIKLCSSALDEGLAAWQLPGRGEVGMYAAWCAIAGLDINPFLQELPDWHAIIAELPDNPEDAIILQLTHLEIPQAQWDGYLRCLALEIPGWSGMINWREQHPAYTSLNDAKPTLSDYLAIRLTLDRLWLNHICRDTWQIEATLSSLKRYFRKNSSEYMVRRHLFRGNLPEYLIQQAETMISSVGTERYNRGDWQNLADIIWTWQGSAMINSRPVHSVYGSAWLLFRLTQHLGLSPAHLQTVSKAELEQLLQVLDEFNSARRSQTWLVAYERRYRESLLQALHSNHQRRKTTRATRPAAQFIFCLDSREEGLRRHLEACNPAIETWASAGFLVEANGAATEEPSASLQQKLGLQRLLGRLWHHSLRGNLLLSPLLMVIAAPFTLIGLLTNVFLPKWQQASADKFNDWFIATAAAPPLHSLAGQATDAEQADRVAQLLGDIGLTTHLSPCVVLMGHTSKSQNNSHLAAYTLGALSIRQDGASAAMLAAMANRPEVRALLAARGFNLPADTWFIAAKHDTCSEKITWYNLEALPPEHQSAFEKCQDNCLQACQRLAQERYRYDAAAPGNLTDKEALQQLQTRAADFSQGRPEAGLAGATALVIGRRAVTQGVFLDSRAFLVSYDAAQDAGGDILQRLLMTVVPAIADINLTYYFSTVDNQQFGSGNSVLHNIIGLFGVMEGSGSDLRFGLPRQMTEDHAAMRLQLVIEAKTSVLQPLFVKLGGLLPLIKNSWIQLSAQDPETGQLFVVEPDLSFIPWQADSVTLPVFAGSAEGYQALKSSVPVALLEECEHG